MLTPQQIYDRLLSMYGAPRWWSEDPCRVMVQAVLVQNTAWSSVEKVTQALEDFFQPQVLLDLPSDRLEELIRPCGFCRRKAMTIRLLMAWYAAYGFDQSRVMAQSKDRLRHELLSVHGIGAETADDILVYAFHKPCLIIDAYTRRFLQRLGFHFADDDAIRAFFTAGLPEDAEIDGHLHWLILDHGLQRCGKAPRCEGCLFGCIKDR